jgi:hypothetical protein
MQKKESIRENVSLTETSRSIITNRRGKKPTKTRLFCEEVDALIQQRTLGFYGYKNR